MIYYDEQILKTKVASGVLTEIPKKVAEGMKALKEEYFSYNPKNLIQFRWKAGEPKLAENSKGQIVAKSRRMFPLEMISEDGRWIFSRRKLPKDKQGNLVFKEQHLIKTTPITLGVEDLELIYFLQNHCPNVVSGPWELFNPEADAKKRNDKERADVNLRYIIFSEMSPMNESNTLFREIMDTFEIEDTGKEESMRRSLYDLVVAGDKDSTMFANTNRLMSMIKNTKQVRYIKVVREAVSKEILYYDPDTWAWKIIGTDYIFLKTKKAEYAERHTVLYDFVLRDLRARYKVFSVMKEANYTTVTEIKKSTRNQLFALAKEAGLNVESKDDRESITIKIIKAHHVHK